MDQNKRKGMWISQNQVGAGTGNTWVIPLITAVLSSEVLLAATIELVRSTDIYTPWVMLTAAGCTAAAYGFLIKLNKQKMFFLASLAVMLIITVAFGRPLINGLCAFWNQAGDAWTAGSGVVTVEFGASTSSFSFLIASVFIGMAAAVLSCVLTSLERYLAVILVPLLIFVGMVTFHSDGTFKYMAVCLVLAMCLLVCGNREERSIKCVVSRCVPVIVCSVVILVIAASSNVEQWALEIGENTHDKLHSARYETEYTTLPEGDFSDYTEKDGASQTALAISMEQPEEMYLRGFTAAGFSQDVWKPLDAEILAANEDLLYWMNTNGFDPQMQFDQAISLIEKNEETKEKSLKKVTIQNLNACSEYMYVPYSLSSEECLIAENISPDGLAADGNRMYTYSVIPEGSGEIGKILKKLKNSDNEKVKEYRQAENSYRQFIYKYYLDIPEDVEAAMSQYWEMISSSENKDRMTTAQAQNYARVFLEECFPENGESPGLDLPLEKAKDSSYQYATVAVLTLRYYGIPARYAEGYIITEEMADGMEKNGFLQLDESCSGAWAEVYQDGIGWMPMNMTPGLEEENSGVDPDAEDGDKPQEIPPKGSMQLDDMDDMAEEPDPDGGYVVSIKKVISFTALLIIAAILLLIAALAVRRHILLKRRTTRWDNENINDAVAWIFADTEYLLKKLGFDRHGGSMTELISSVEEILGSDYTRSFEEMIIINSRAVFSSHKLDEEGRETAKAFYSYTLEHLRSGAKWHKRLWMQWVLCLY
ncbi:MAG: hypothetical protein IKM63_00555 [Firmicutes bacterium]|nr:hypothetical protein [Bacillota bacterium]MBR6798538.1 hypothetical protein [Bacillota bacterium]